MQLTPLKIAVIAVLAAVAVGLIIFDIFLATNSEKGDTISEIIAFYSSRSLLIPAVAGVLIGHFWIYNTWWDAPGYMVLGVFIMLGLLWLGFDIHMIVSKGNVATDGFLGFIHKWPILNLIFHTAVGHIIWGQNLLK